QERLIELRQETIGNYLKEAEELRKRKDFLAAMACLDSAWHLQPNDPTIIEVQERIQASQEEEIILSFEPRMDLARNLLAEGREEEALAEVEQILEDYQPHGPAKQLREQIEQSRWNKAQDRITQDLELAIQPLSFCDFELSCELLAKLQSE